MRAGQDGSRRGGQEPPSESTSWPVINARTHCTISRSCSSRCCSCVSACSGRTSFVACRWAGRSDMRGGPGRAHCGEDGVDVQHPCVCPGRSSWRASADARRADGARLERDARWRVARGRACPSAHRGAHLDRLAGGVYEYCSTRMRGTSAWRAGPDSRVQIGDLLSNVLDSRSDKKWYASRPIAPGWHFVQ